MGLRRNLEVWEIIEQVREVRADLAAAAEENGKLRGRVHGVLFQGMGEPLANVDRVIAAIRILQHHRLHGGAPDRDPPPGERGPGRSRGALDRVGTSRPAPFADAHR